MPDADHVGRVKFDTTDPAGKNGTTGRSFVCGQTRGIRIRKPHF